MDRIILRVKDGWLVSHKPLKAGRWKKVVLEDTEENNHHFLPQLLTIQVDKEDK